jgi:hypothetical protein
MARIAKKKTTTESDEDAAKSLASFDEDNGPFSKVFLIDSAAVLTLMEKAFGKTSFWTNVCQYSRKKEGRKAWWPL